MGWAETTGHRVLGGALRFDFDQLDVAVGIRVALVVTVPVIVGAVTSNVFDGMVACLGALNVAVADSVGSYRSRAVTLGTVAVTNAVSLGLGMAAALTGTWAIALLFGWVLVVSYLGVLGPTVNRAGWCAALMFMIGIGLGAPTVALAGRNAGLAAAGGAWAFAVITALWPFQPGRAAFRAVGRCHVQTARLLEAIGQGLPAPAIEERTRAVDAALDDADAVARWGKARRARNGRAQRRAQHLLRWADQAGAYSAALGQRVIESSDDAAREASTRQVAAQLGAGFLVTARRLGHGSDPAADGTAAEIAAIAGAARRRLLDEHLGDPDLHRLCDTLSAAASMADDSGQGEAPPLSPAPVSRTKALRANLTLSSLQCRYALRFAIAAAVALAVAQTLGLDKGYWVVITVAVVVKPQLSLSTTSTALRVVGTLIGAVVAIGLAILCDSQWALIVALFAMTTLAIATIRVNYGLAVVFITPLVVVLLNVPHPGQWQLADTRALNTLLGAAIGLLATTTILRGSEQDLLSARAGVALEKAAAYLHAVGHEPRATRSAARRAVRHTGDEYAAIADRAASEPGALRPGHVGAALRLAELVTQLWEDTADLSLRLEPGHLEPGLTEQIDALERRVRASGRLLDDGPRAAGTPSPPPPSPSPAPPSPSPAPPSPSPAPPPSTPDDPRAPDPRTPDPRTPDDPRLASLSLLVDRLTPAVHDLARTSDHRPDAP